MSHGPPLNEATRRFLVHFTELMDAAAQRDSSGNSSGGELAFAPDQRKALTETLHRWVECLVAAPTSTESNSNKNKNKSKNSANSHNKGEQQKEEEEEEEVPGTSFMLGEMGDRWFAHPHLALIPTPWTNPRDPYRACLPPLSIPHKRNKPSSSSNTYGGSSMHSIGTSASGSDVRLRLLGDLQRLCDEPSPDAFADALLCALRPSGEAHCAEIARWAFFRAADGLARSSEPPAAMLADVLFSEWCRAAVGGASFASTHVPLRLVESDLAEFRKAGVNGGEAAGRGAVVGTVAGLACAHPMHTADAPEKTDTSEETLQAFVERNTATFRVPLASVVLDVYHVGLDGRVRLARQETQYRGGEMEWHSVGDSKRHRHLLDSIKKEK